MIRTEKGKKLTGGKEVELKIKAISLFITSIVVLHICAGYWGKASSTAKSEKGKTKTSDGTAQRLQDYVAQSNSNMYCNDTRIDTFKMISFVSPINQQKLY